MKIKFNSDDDFPLSKILKFHNLTQLLDLFLHECLYELQTLEYDRVDLSEGTDINKTNASKECDICHYWYFLDKGFK